MAVYKIFPTKDATIYSRYPNKNTGLDEILDVSIEDAQDSGNTQSNRFLVQFSQTEITDILTNKYGSLLGYSDYSYDLAGATKDNIIYPSLDPMIFEIRYPNNDIKGRVVSF